MHFSGRYFRCSWPGSVPIALEQWTGSTVINQSNINFMGSSQLIHVSYQNQQHKTLIGSSMVQYDMKMDNKQKWKRM